MDDIRATARNAATLQLIAHRYRDHARDGVVAGSQFLRREAAALDWLAACLLSDGLGSTPVASSASTSVS